MADDRALTHVPAAEVTTLVVCGERVGCAEPGSGTSMVTTFIATTSGDVDLVSMCTVVPPGEGVTPRTHDGVDESFYGLDGELELVAGGRSFRIGPGAYAMVPGGLCHSWRNAGDTLARVMRTCVSAGHENYPFRLAASDR